MILQIDTSGGDPAAREKLLREHLPSVRKNGWIVVAGNVPKPVRIAVFDLDATLIPCEFIDEVAASRGLAHLTRELTDRAMNGGMDFRESYLRRLEIMRGTSIDEIEHLIEGLPLAPGAAETLSILRTAGCRTAIITGGYARLGRAVQNRLDIDALYATELDESGGCLTGRLAGPLLDEDGKVAALKDFCARNGMTAKDAVAVGDGANDLKMLAAAGLAILYTSTPGAGQQPRPLDVILEYCV